MWHIPGVGISGSKGVRRIKPDVPCDQAPQPSTKGEKIRAIDVKEVSIVYVTLEELPQDFSSGFMVRSHWDLILRKMWHHGVRWPLDLIWAIDVVNIFSLSDGPYRFQMEAKVEILWFKILVMMWQWGHYQRLLKDCGKCHISHMKRIMRFIRGLEPSVEPTIRWHLMREGMKKDEITPIFGTNDVTLHLGHRRFWKEGMVENPKILFLGWGGITSLVPM